MADPGDGGEPIPVDPDAGPPAEPDAGRPPTAGFGYPVGDLTTHPAGGWAMTQVLGHHWPSQGGRHLAQDIAKYHSDGPTQGESVHSVADGTVLFAGPNSSTYKNIVFIEHPLGDGTRVCSFYGHLTTAEVTTGQRVRRGDVIARVLDYAETGYGGSDNSHLHYVFLDDALCEYAAGLANNAPGSSGICGYDTGPDVGIGDLDEEPLTFTSLGDGCRNEDFADGFISPSQFIEANHF